MSKRRRRKVGVFFTIVTLVIITLSEDTFMVFETVDITASLVLVSRNESADAMLSMVNVEVNCKTTGGNGVG